MANLKIKDIKEALSEQLVPPGAPSPSKKRDFILSLEPSGFSFIHSLLHQVGYIRLHFWITSLLFTFIAVLITIFFSSVHLTLYFISALLPFISLSALSELRKSNGYQMEELEMSCRYNLSHVILMRLIIVGLVDTILVGISLVLSAYITGHLLSIQSLYVIAPFMLTSALTLWISLKNHRQDALYICAGVAFLISILSFYLPAQLPMLYTPSMNYIWMITCLVLIPFIIYPIVLLQKKPMIESPTL